MDFETNEQLLEENDSVDSPTPQAPVIGALPADLVFTERAAAALRAYLAANGLSHYRIFFATNDVYDVETHLDALGEVAAWEPVGSVTAGGETIHAVTHRRDDDASGEREGGAGKLWESGFLRLARAEVVVARWYWSIATATARCNRCGCAPRRRPTTTPRCAPRSCATAARRAGRCGRSSAGARTATA